MVEQLSETARSLIQARVLERAKLESAASVEDTCSFARAERILQREYHGRFLIELLQNAADAWRARREGDERTDVRIVLSAASALLVANRGTRFPAEAVISSLGQIGASTKDAGQAIGHKGIGFKSVLEVTERPELYSGMSAPASAVAVRFDPHAALGLIRENSPSWEEHLSNVRDIETELDAVPRLRYPTWIDQPDNDVQALIDDGYDTVVRLPFDAGTSEDPAPAKQRWLETVRRSFEQVTDEMLLLLGTFSRVEIRDELGGQPPRVVEPYVDARRALDGETQRASVAVHVDGVPSSRWQLYTRTMPGRTSLAGEITVGVRIDGDRIVPAVGGEPSAPFHLFFPTRIGSGLPFLLHGYFEVDAARTGFYEGSAASNQAILDALAELASVAIADLAVEQPEALITLPDLLGAPGAEPENLHARSFRDGVLDRLDRVAWVPVRGEAGGIAVATPLEVLVDENRMLVDRVVETFPADCINRTTSLRVPVAEIGEDGLRHLDQRQPDRDIWMALEQLVRPGPGGAWSRETADAGFASLVELIALLQASDRSRTKALLDGVRGDEHACLLPVVAADGGRDLLPVPNIEEGRPGRRSRLVMARVRRRSGTPLVPPPSLDVAFLPDGLLGSQDDIARAAPLGLREFTVDNVLDRLARTVELGSEPEPVLAFVWSLLSREPTGQFSTRSAVERAAEFNPGLFFWCTPGESARGGFDADRQRRRRALASTRLPAQDGTWQAAETLAFGAAWADWLESGACGPVTGQMRARARAYRGLEAVAPSPSSLLAAPDLILSFLPSREEDLEDEIERPPEQKEMHTFLLMLGVWEVLPVEAFAGRATRQPRRPFPGTWDDEREAEVVETGGWVFADGSWSGTAHQNVYVAEDFRFRWPLEETATRDPEATAKLLSSGANIYRRLARIAAFCPNCSSDGRWHKTTHQTSAADAYPSLLALELQRSRWVPATVDGTRLDQPQTASSTWWTERPPGGAGLRRSPMRFLRLCAQSAEISAELRALAGIPSLQAAPIDRIAALLDDLREQYESQRLPIDPGSGSSARQAFVGLHRLMYERLADLIGAGNEAAASVLASVGVLCEVGDQLVHCAPADVRHDDGTHVSFRRYFEGDVPFVVLARDKGAVAKRLGLATFAVRLTRKDTADGQDVTADVAEMLGDRIPELLSIVVHHSLGTQTLEPSSADFEERARRLRNLRVVRVADLVIDAEVDGLDLRATIGENATEELYLEGATTSTPVLYHDIAGDKWQETLRRKLPVHLAALVENAAYAATFALFLLAGDDGEREDVLRDLGIAADEVDGIRSIVGAVSDEERAGQRRWFTSILRACERNDLADVLTDDVAGALLAAGLGKATTARLVELGGGPDRRDDRDGDGALSTLDAAGVSLEALDQALRAEDPADGLRIDVAGRRLRHWLRAHGQRVSAVLASRWDANEAKRLPATWTAPPEFAFALDPAPGQWLAPVLESLSAAGFDPDADALATQPVEELVRLAGARDRADLDRRVTSMLDPVEHAKRLREMAAAWRRELRFLLIVTRTHKGQSRSAIRAAADVVERELPGAPKSPAELAEPVAELLDARASLASRIADVLEDGANNRPSRTRLLALAGEAGIDTGHRGEVETAIEAQASDRARKTRADIDRLRHAAVRPQVPATLRAAPRPAPGDSGGRKKHVSRVKVDATSDARKRRAGDEGERWMITAVLEQLVGLAPEERRSAIDELLALLDHFTGDVVDEARRHAELAADPQLDDEELIEELTEFLHVSRRSDAFGFDMLGWLRTTEDAEPRAMFLEVKSIRDGRFHLSRGEWTYASRLSENGDGDLYVVATVTRGVSGRPPKSIDLLVDPVRLVERRQLEKLDDGYELSYRTSA